MRIKNVIIAVLWIATLSTFACASIDVMDHFPPAKVKGQAFQKSTGEKLWTNTITTSKTESNGKKLLYVEEKGEGLWGGEKKWRTWTSTSFFNMDGDKITPNQVKVVFKDMGGVTTRTLEKYYYPSTKKIMCRDSKDNGKAKYFEYTSDTFDKEELRIALPNYDFDSGKKNFEFHLLTHEPSLYKFNAKLLGTETVKLKDKGLEVECYKFELIPDLGAANIFGSFIPKTYFWLDAAVPHQFIKYEGLESGLGTPYIEIEAVK